MVFDALWAKRLVAFSLCTVVSRLFFIMEGTRYIGLLEGDSQGRSGLWNVVEVSYWSRLILGRETEGWIHYSNNDRYIFCKPKGNYLFCMRYIISLHERRASLKDQCVGVGRILPAEIKYQQRAVKEPAAAKYLWSAHFDQVRPLIIPDQSSRTLFSIQ